MVKWVNVKPTTSESAYISQRILSNLQIFSWVNMFITQATGN